jgi:spore coat protein U domain-containing protein, fimbrial subunit CupE1/2/3/6
MNPTQRDRERICRARAARKRVLGLALGLGLATAEAAAVTCTISTPGIAFGAYDVYAPGATNSNGTLTLTCSLDLLENNTTVNYSISLSTGLSNSYAQRQMKSGINSLGYNLYTTNGYSVVLGDGTGTTQTISGQMKLKKNDPSDTNTHTVYGRIPALQDVAVSPLYTDIIIVTATY